jgi:hypothetical protein
MRATRRVTYAFCTIGYNSWAEGARSIV